MEKKTQTYNDGVLTIYRVTNIAEAGNKPKDEIEKIEDLRYDEKTVGMSRFYTGLQVKRKIELLLRTQRRDTVKADQIVIPNDGQQYRIIQVQYPKDVSPASMDLSLERVESTYEIR